MGWAATAIVLAIQNIGGRPSTSSRLVRPPSHHHLATLAPFFLSLPLLSLASLANVKPILRQSRSRMAPTSVLNTDNFYGVAYAQPPLGAFRFRQPQPLSSTWNGSRVVVDYPKQCITTGKLTSIVQALKCRLLALNRTPNNVA